MDAVTDTDTKEAKALRKLVQLLEVTTPESGLHKGTLVLWWIMDTEHPDRRMCLANGRSTYNETALSEISRALKEAREVLGMGT